MGVNTNVICPLLDSVHLTLSSLSLSIISCEEGVSVDQFQSVEELLALIASFTMLGKAELKVALCVTNPQPPAFKFDPPLTKGKPSLQHKFCIVILRLPLCNYLTVDCIISLNSEPSLLNSHSEPSNYLNTDSSATISVEKRMNLPPVLLQLTT